MLLVRWKLLQFAEFPLINCSGRGDCPEGPQSGLSEVSTCFLLIQLLFILRPVIRLLWMLSATHAISSYSSRREEFLFPTSKLRSKLYDSKSRNETKQPKIRSPLVRRAPQETRLESSLQRQQHDSCSLTHHFHRAHHSIPESAQEENRIKRSNPSKQQSLLVRYALPWLLEIFGV